MHNALKYSLSKLPVILFLIFAICPFLQAQVPQYANSTAVQLPNKFPFNEAMGKRVQSLYLPAEFIYPSPAPPGNIRTLYYLFAVALGPYTYSDFTVRMGQSDITNLVSGVWFDGQLDTVFHRSSVTFSAAAGSWLEIHLDRSIAYNPARSLIIEVQQCAVPGAASVGSATGVVFGNRRNVSTGGESCPFLNVGATDGIIHTIGFTFGTPTNSGNQSSSVISSYELLQNFPNPFNPETTIGYSVPESGNVDLRVYNILGEEVAVIVNDFRNAGKHYSRFDASDLPSGIYYYKLSSGNFSDIKKMTILK